MSVLASRGEQNTRLMSVYPDIDRTLPERKK